MRDALFLMLVVVATGFSLWRPLYAAMTYAWISLMAPHTLTWGIFATLPWAYYFGVILLVSLLISKEPWARGNWGGYVPALLFFSWTTITLLTAMAPDAAYARWVVMLKIQIAMLLTLLVISDRGSITKLIWVIALSLGFYGLKGGVFTLVTGGQFVVSGPPTSFIQDNNHLAVALLAAIPLLVWLREQTGSRMLRTGLAGIAMFSGLAAFATYSRGALVAGAIGGVFLLARSRRRLPIIIGLAILVPFVTQWMPEEYWTRMSTILADDPDGSVQGRFTAWSVAVNVANERLTGGGFDYYRAPDLYANYLGAAGIPRAAHSIYYQVLGDHGWFGLGLYVFMIIWFFWGLSRSRVLARDRDSLLWAHTLSGYLQVSCIVLLSGGAFLSLAYWEFVYYLFALTSGLLAIVKKTRDFTQGATADG